MTYGRDVLKGELSQDDDRVHPDPGGPPQGGVAPHLRIGKRWFNTVWLIPLGAALLLFLSLGLIPWPRSFAQQSPDPKQANLVAYAHFKSLTPDELTSFPPREPCETAAQQAAGGTDATQTAAKTANMTSAWLSGKLSTPGTSAELVELKRSKVNDHLWVLYGVVVKGAPKQQTYKLFSWRIDAPAPSEAVKGLSVGPDGIVVCAVKEECKGDKEGAPIELMFFPMRGEVFREVLVSADGETKTFFGTVADPIIERNSSCSLEVVRLMPKFELALVRGKGYSPYDELLETSSRADSDGGFISALLPFVKDKQNGTTTLSLKGEACAPALSFEWGK